MQVFDNIFRFCNTHMHIESIFFQMLYGYPAATAIMQDLQCNLSTGIVIFAMAMKMILASVENT